MIGILLGIADADLRQALAKELRRAGAWPVLGDTGTPARLVRLAVARRPSLVVFDLGLLEQEPGLIGHLLAVPRRPRLLACAESLADPALVVAVRQGVHGCLATRAATAVWNQALHAIHAGESWIPRALLVRALHELRQPIRENSPCSPPIGQLTERQHEIVRQLARGLSNKEIGRSLGISPTTVKTHLQNIFERAGVSGRQRLVAQALRQPTQDIPPPRALRDG